MFLKKELLHIPFLKRKCFNIEYDDIKDLKLGVVSLCELLKKDAFLIQIFTGDPLNEEFRGGSDNLCKYKNFNVYLIKNVEAVKRLNFENIRFLNIYGIDNRFVTDEFNEMIKCSSFSLGFDNCFEYTKIIIDFSKYDDCIISKLPLRKFML